MATNYTVWEYIGEGEAEVHHPVVQGVDAATAVTTAHASANKPAATLGVIREVLIVDNEDDSVVFHWVFDKGVIHPTPEEIERMKRETDH